MSLLLYHSISLSISEDFPLGAIVGISVGGAVLIIGLGVLLVWVKKNGYDLEVLRIGLRSL